MAHVTDGTTQSTQIAATSWQRALYISGVLFLLAVLWGRFLGQPDYAFTTILFETQDFTPALAIGTLLIALGMIAPRLAPPAMRLPSGRLAIAFLICAATLVAAAGVHLVFYKYGLTRDEAMADFDARILATGRLVVAVAPDWRPYIEALEPEFRFRIADGLAWSSAYLPGNAALRAAVGVFIDSAWTSPLLTALAASATWSCARTLWPGRDDAALLAAVLVGVAPQVLVTGMTPYAMTAHLALNMLWLRLFLQNTKAAHAGAVATGWLACGLHQVIFHPLFVAPFILQMWMERRRRLAIFYVGSYALIGIFWISYARIVMTLYGLQPEASAFAGLSGLSAIIQLLLSNFSIFGLNTMVKNLIRFASWQHIALLPLVIAALRGPHKLPPVLVSLGAGLALCILAMFILLPYQGHGWGYRYLHGFIGAAALIAAFGWIHLTSESEVPSARPTFAVLAATIATLVLLLPLRAWQAHNFVAPYAASYTRIASADADVVIVDRTGLMFAVDLVRNDPLLQKTPKILDLASLDEQQITDLCRNNRVAIFDRGAGAALGIPVYETETEADAKRREKRNFLNKSGCGAAIAAN